MRVERACTFGHEKKGANRVSSGGNNWHADEMVAHNGAMLHIAIVVRVVHCAVAGCTLYVARLAFSALLPFIPEQVERVSGKSFE